MAETESEKIRRLESVVAEQQALLHWIEDASQGLEVDDFGTSFPLVAVVQLLYRNAMHPSLHLRAGTVETNFGSFLQMSVLDHQNALVGEGTSRRPRHALAYALEDLASQLKVRDAQLKKLELVGSP